MQNELISEVRRLNLDYLFCIKCGSLLLDDDIIENFLIRGTINTRSCVLKGKEANGKEYKRKICFECFEKEFHRKPKSLNTLNVDTAYLLQIPQEDLAAANKAKYGLTIEHMIAKHGQIEGQRIWTEYCNKQSVKNKFETKQKKYGWTKDKFDEFNKSRGVTLVNLIKKYGEIEGKKKFDAYCDRQSYAGNKLEYFIEKYGEEEGKKKYINVSNQKILNIENFIRKYGPILGPQKYQNYSNRNISSISAISQKLFFALKTQLNRDNIWFGQHRGEYGMYLHDINQYVFLDFYDFKTNKAIEFFGDYWHANPKQYREKDIINQKGIHYNVVDIWEKDLARINAIIKQKSIKGLLIVWENDYYNDPDRVLFKCLEFLKD